MGKAVQYYNGLNWQQFGLTTQDILIEYANLDVVANNFHTVKDSNDNIYISCFPLNNQSSGVAPEYGKIIKIDKLGNKTISKIGLWYKAYTAENQGVMILSRDETKLFVSQINAAGKREIATVDIADIVDDQTITTTAFMNTSTTSHKFAIYQDRYIWVASGSTVKIYDYETKAELASASTTNTVFSLCCSDTNTLYITDYNQQIKKLVFNGVSIITVTALTVLQTQLVNVKQLLIDKWGDLIILTNSGTVSTLLKYTTAGVQIGTTLGLSGASYNLNTDYEGNYYYSNALGTYKITANTAQGQAFTGTGTLIRSSGMTTYGNNITNFNPSVFG
jgi:hypothetical protein